MDFMVGDNMDKLNIELPELTAATPRASGTMRWSSGASFPMIVDWSTSPNVGGGYTTVSVTMRMQQASVTGTCQAGSHITINGNKSSFANKYLNYGGNGTNFTLHSHSVNIYHSTAVNIPISGAWAWNGYIWVSGSYSGRFNTVSGSGTVSCAAILTPPGAPSNLSLTGRFENGMSTYLTWSKGSGTVANYEVQRRFWKKYNDSYSGWHDVNLNYGDANTTSITIQHSAVGDHSQQVRIRAKNSAGASSWVESNWIAHDGVNVYTNNSGSKTYGKVRVWNGSSWVQGYVSVWTGSSWSTTK